MNKDLVLSAVIGSNMDQYFNKKNIIRSANEYMEMMLDKYLKIRNSDKENYVQSFNRRRQRKYANRNFEKQKTYYDLLVDRYDDAIELIGDWLDRNS